MDVIILPQLSNTWLVSIETPYIFCSEENVSICLLANLFCLTFISIGPKAQADEQQQNRAVNLNRKSWTLWFMREGHYHGLDVLLLLQVRDPALFNSAMWVASVFYLILTVSMAQSLSMRRTRRLNVEANWYKQQVNFNDKNWWSEQGSNPGRWARNGPGDDGLTNWATDSLDLWVSLEQINWQIFLRVFCKLVKEPRAISKLSYVGAVLYLMICQECTAYNSQLKLHLHTYNPLQFASLYLSLFPLQTLSLNARVRLCWEPARPCLCLTHVVNSSPLGWRTHPFTHLPMPHCLLWSHAFHKPQR